MRHPMRPRGLIGVYWGFYWGRTRRLRHPLARPASIPDHSDGLAQLIHSRRISANSSSDRQIRSHFLMASGIEVFRPR